MVQGSTGLGVWDRIYYSEFQGLWGLSSLWGLRIEGLRSFEFRVGFALLTSGAQWAPNLSSSVFCRRSSKGLFRDNGKEHG